MGKAPVNALQGVGATTIWHGSRITLSTTAKQPDPPIRGRALGQVVPASKVAVGQTRLYVAKEASLTLHVELAPRLRKFRNHTLCIITGFRKIRIPICEKLRIMSESVPVSEKIRRARRAKELTQEGLDDALGVPHGRIFAYEKGRAAVPEVVVRRIAKALDVMPDWFFDGEDTPPPIGKPPPDSSSSLVPDGTSANPIYSPGFWKI